MTSEQLPYCLNSSGHREPSFGQGSHDSGRPVQVAVGASPPQGYTYDSDGRLCVVVHKSHIHDSPHQDFVYVSAHGLPSVGMGQAFNTDAEPQTGSSISSPNTLVGKSDTAKPRRPRVKVVCTNCRSAKKACSNSRPCARCCQLNMHHSCCDELTSSRGKRMRNEQQDVTTMEPSSQQLFADNLGPPAWTSVQAQVSTGDHQQHAQASLDTLGNMWQSQEPSASMSPTWVPTPSQNGLTVSDLMGSWNVPEAAQVYQTASQQSFSHTANPSFNIHRQGPTFL